MKLVVIFCLVGCKFKPSTPARAMSLQYNRIYSSDNKHPSANVLVQHSDVLSLSECALKAVNNHQCSSFFFNKAASSCTLTGRLCASQLTLSFGYQHFFTDSTADSSLLSCAYENIGKHPSWNTAKLECEDRGGYLVELQSYNEQQFVRSILVPPTDPGWVPVFWLGGRKTNGQFEWINGGKFEFSNWRPGYPDNQESNVCMIFADVDWKNYICTDNRPAICEFTVY